MHGSLKLVSVCPNVLRYRGRRSPQIYPLKIRLPKKTHSQAPGVSFRTHGHTFNDKYYEIPSSCLFPIKLVFTQNELPKGSRTSATWHRGLTQVSNRRRHLRNGPLGSSMHQSWHFCSHRLHLGCSVHATVFIASAGKRKNAEGGFCAKSTALHPLRIVEPYGGYM